MNALETILGSSALHYGPILLAGAFALAIFAERTKALFITYPMQNLQGFFEIIRELVMNNRLPEAIAMCDRYQNKPAAQVIKAALLRAHQPEELIQNGLALAVSDAISKIQRRTQFLATIANVATLLGLLGTIFGLVSSFAAIGNADAMQKSTLLASGIATAMNATILGLSVAIPSMIAFSFLANRTNRLGTDIDQAAIRTLDILKQRYYDAGIGLTTSGNSVNAAAVGE